MIEGETPRPQRLEDYEYEYDPASVEPALPVLLNQLPRLREGTRGMFDFGVEMVVGRVVLRLLRRVEDETERLAIVERVLPHITQLSGRMELIDTVGHRENVGHKLIDEAAAQRLYSELYDGIMRVSPEALADERQLVSLFVRLIESDKKRGLARVRDVCATDQVMLRLLRAGLREQRAQTMGDYAVRSRPALPWELFVEWFGEKELNERISGLSERTSKDDLDERTRSALETAEKYARGELSNGSTAPARLV